MSPERWKQVEEIFNSAIDLPPDERPAFLARVCGDDAELRRQIKHLLESDERAGDFIESHALDSRATRLTGVTVADETGELPGGRRIGAYELLREIGRGGMGAVYLAARADNEFNRRVAIKVVKRGMDTDFIIRRFRHERQILAGFDHPNIARLLDGGTTEDGRPYFVMEYIEGQPITRWCDERRLSVTERLKLFRQVCAAVEYAHRNLIVHRDIKPGNILVTAEGTPKLLDFGIAKILNPQMAQDTVDPTLTGLRLMTPEYASPEQVRGLPVTPASDQYSLGVLLYELVTGHRPHRLRHRPSHEVARIICEEDPERLDLAVNRTGESEGGDLVTPAPEIVSRNRGATPEALRRELSGGLSNIVMRALRKEAHERYASVAELSEDINRYLTGRPIAALAYTPTDNGFSPVRNSIAILPLKPLHALLAGDSTTGFLGVGLADALITRLGNIQSLTVRPTASVMKYARAEADARAAGRELNVSYVLDGRILKAGERIRVTVQLISTHTEAPVWAAQFDEKDTDLLELQDSISEQVAEAIVKNLSGEERRQLARRGTENREAYEAYLRGRYHWHTYTEDGLARAITCFYEAIALDPGFAAAYTGVADYFNWMGITAVLPPDECFMAAKEAATRAVRLDDRLAEAYASLAVATWAYDWNRDASEELIQKAIELNGNYAQGYEWLAQFRSVQGRHVEAVSAMRRALQLDPQSPALHAMMSFILHNARRHAEAYEYCRRALEIEPNYHLALEAMGWLYPHAGTAEEALAACEQAVRITGRTPLALWVLAHTLAVTGKRSEARVVLNEMTGLSRERYIPNYYFVRIHAALGENDRAFERLGGAFDNYESLVQEMPVDPQLDPLRDDPRFADALARIRPRHGSVQADETISDTGQGISHLSGRSDVKEFGVPPSGGLFSHANAKARLKAVLRTPFIPAAVILLACAVALFVWLKSRANHNVTAKREGGPINLTSHVASDRFPKVSPDGKKIVFTSNRDGLPEIYVLNLDGGGVRRLTFNSTEELAPSWSPDGARILYDVMTGSGAASDIWVMSADGSNQTKLTGGVGYNSRAVFSPDGKRIAFASRSDAGDENNFDIQVMNADGTDRHSITSDPGFETEPAWSPDGRRIAFARTLEKGYSDIFVINADGTNPVNLTNTPAAHESLPAWSPDGRLIAFVTDRHAQKNNADVWVMNADGSNPRPVTHHPSMNIEPSWTPDGRHVVFQTSRDGNNEIYFVDVESNIEAVSRGATTKSIAVLPFRTEGKDETQQSLGLGLADELTSRLSQLKQLSVRPVSAVRPYLESSAAPPQIAGELGVEYVVSGTLEHAGERVQVSARMFSTRDNRILWAEKFDEKATDLVTLRNSIAGRVLRALTLELTGSELQQFNKRPTGNSEAYQLYLVGRYHLGKRAVAGLREAIGYFNQALRHDDKFALAYAGLADCYALLQLYEGSAGNAYPRARENALKALALDDSLTEAHASLAYVKFYFDRDHKGAEREFRRSIELNPSYATAHHWLANALSALGRHDEAVAEIGLARQLDPHSAIICSASGMTLFYARQYEPALEECRRALEFDPGLVPAHRVVRWIAEARGRADEAFAAYQQEKSFSGDAGRDWPVILAQIRAVGGKREEALATLRQALGSPATRREAEFLPYEVALAYALLGDREQAMPWLARAEASKAHSFNFALVDPRLDQVRSDPRFAELLRKAGFTH